MAQTAQDRCTAERGNSALRCPLAAAHTGKVYLFGGARPFGWAPTATAWVYDPEPDMWSRLSDMPQPRMSGAAIAMGRYMYIVGGVGASDNPALLRYEPATDTWTRLAAPNEAREHTTAVALAGKIYALGGRWGGAGERNSVETYDPATDTWTFAPPMVEARAGFAATALLGQMPCIHTRPNSFRRSPML